MLPEGGANKTFPAQPSNLPASQKKSAAERHYFGHALETSFPWSGMGQAYIPLSVPGALSLSAGCVGAGASRGAGAPCARQRDGVAARSGPALRDSRHLPEPYLAAQHGAGRPSVPSHGAQWLVVVGTSCPVGGKKKPFL